MLINITFLTWLHVKILEMDIYNAIVEECFACPRQQWSPRCSEYLEQTKSTNERREQR